jgi:ribosomal protein S18 acetylase RimI-like enzyme
MALRCGYFPAMKIASYAAVQFEGVRALWEEVFPSDPPWNRAEIAIPQKLAVQPELFLVAESDGVVIGTAMAGYDGHRGWLYTIAVRPDFQRQGIGSALISEAEGRLRLIGCDKINLQIRAGNEEVVAFYRRHGYDVEERVSMGKRMSMS